METSLHFHSWAYAYSLAVLFLSLVAAAWYVSASRATPSGPSQPALDPGALNHLPGPESLRRTHSVRQSPLEEHWALLALHRRYGPIVRHGPHHVSVAHPEGIKAIYRQGTPFYKTDWYAMFTEKKNGVVFTIQDPKLHSQRRRIVSHAFSLSSSRAALLPFIRNKAEIAVKNITSGGTGTTDICAMMRRFAGDVSLKLSLGQDWRQVETGESCDLVNDLVARGSADDVTRRLAAGLSGWCAPLWRSFGSGDVGTASRILRADQTVERAVSDFCRRYQRGQVGSEELLARIIESKDPETGRAMDFRTLCREARGFILAASDTTANTLTLAVHHISANPKVSMRLHEELKKAMPLAESSQQEPVAEDEGQGDASYFASLPYLSACIKETYRLSPAVAKLLPRWVPPGGCRMAGYDIPAGAVVGTSVFVQHRWDEALWGPPEYADAFQPERWLPGAATEEQLKEMNRCLTPFSQGPRACLGRWIAEMEIHVMVAKLFRRVRPVRVVTPPEEMKEKGFFIVGPQGGKCLIEFEPVV